MHGRHHLVGSWLSSQRQEKQMQSPLTAGASASQVASEGPWPCHPGWHAAFLRRQKEALENNSYGASGPLHRPQSKRTTRRQSKPGSVQPVRLRLPRLA